jgi:hypothetical protein
VLLCAFIIVAFAGHQNIITFKFSCIEIKAFIVVAAVVFESVNITGHGNL